VFDTSRLVLLLKAEGERWLYQFLEMADVIYSSDSDAKFREECGANMETLSKSIASWLKTNDPTSLENTYYPLIACACRYKHGGFHEESEVRIVAIPPNKKQLAAAKASGLVTEEILEKPRRVFLRSNTAVPCIHLFEGTTQLPEKPLPVTRIIVGPHRDKDKRRRAVEILLDQYNLNIPVSVSDIPYVGHSA
jgi:hypothetical protein